MNTVSLDLPHAVLRSTLVDIDIKIVIDVPHHLISGSDDYVYEEQHH